MAQTTNTSPPKHDIHKFRDVKPRLGRDNWTSWKRELLATARDRGLYGIITGTDLIPRETSPTATVTDDIVYIGMIPLTLLVDEWNDRNNSAYNQILLCISPELQTAIDDTDQAKSAWDIIVKKFESTDPSKISIIRTKYENYHMVEGQSVVTYLTTMREYRNQLKKMGEIIADSTHAATILRNVPESWRTVAQTIRMITRIPDEIEESLEAHEADLSALEISDQAATAFIARTKPNRSLQNRQIVNTHPTPRNNPQTFSNPPRSPFTCNNCGRTGHSVARCYAVGGGLEGQAPWMKTNEHTVIPPPKSSNPFTNRIRNNTLPRPIPDSIRLAETKPDDIIMVAQIADHSKPTRTEFINPMITNAEELSQLDDNKPIWLIDSAASSHISGNKALFHNMHTIAPIKIDIANGESFVANERGTIRITITSDPRWELDDVPITLTNVIYAPKLKSNLLSVGRMTNSNVSVHFGKHTSWLVLNGKIIAYGPKENHLYTYVAFPIAPMSETADYASDPSGPTLWHHRLAHTSYHIIDNMRKLQTAEGFSPGIHYGPNPQCLNCPYGKQTRAPFRKVEKLPNHIGDLIVSDICGPFEPSIGNYRYFITWIETKTRFATIDFIKNKESSTITTSFRNYTAWLLRQKSANVKRIRSDNGGEYTGKEFQDICAKSGIIHETTSPHTPEHNGIAERYNRTLQDGALTLRHDAGLSGRFWVSAIHTVNFVKNRVLHSRLGISPYQAFWGTKPKVDWLRIYGSKCWALIPKSTRLKNQYKSIEGIFVGYYDNSKAYKIWIPRTNTVLKARDAIFDEYNHIERVTIHATDNDDLPNLWTRHLKTSFAVTTIPSDPIISEPGADPAVKSFDEQQTSDEPEHTHVSGAGPTPTTNITSSPDIPTLDENIYEPEFAPKDFYRGSWLDPDNSIYGRGKRSETTHTGMTATTNESSDPKHTERVFVVLAEDEPNNYRDAMSSPNSQKWRSSCEEEYDTLMGYHTWKLVERPPNVNIVGCRWTFRVKRDNLGAINKYKSRLVAQGFSQIEGLDFYETFSPTIRFTTIRLILAFACRYNLELRHIDIKGAYLNGKLEDDVYMRQPEGFIADGQQHLVCKLNKGIYGLRQSGHVWHRTLRTGLEKLGFITGEADATVFFRYGEQSIEIAGWYVDDGLLAADSVESMERMVTDIGGSFDIQDLGEPERLLGIKIKRDRNIGTIHLSQPAFIDTIAKRFDISIGKSAKSPMSPDVKLLKTDAEADSINVPYASLIGSINYCAIATRPDISYATNKCAQFTSKPSLLHWEAAKRIVKYLLESREHGILFRRDIKKAEQHIDTLVGYTDADYAGDSNDRKSTTGWIYLFNGSPISWASKKQSLVARSSMESELIAGSFASVEGTWLIRLAKDFKHNLAPIPLHTDNQPFIFYSTNDINNTRTKHIDTHYHYTRDQISKGNIELSYISTLDNLADILTKPLSLRKHTSLLERLGVKHV